ncbi:hypothetical protein HK405_009296 [Cladochytrium tenue]|nr:hypothetical protein HK405_009296 [Cladochytrium tenue]
MFRSSSNAIAPEVPSQAPVAVFPQGEGKPQDLEGVELRGLYRSESVSEAGRSLATSSRAVSRDGNCGGALDGTNDNRSMSNSQLGSDHGGARNDFLLTQTNVDAVEIDEEPTPTNDALGELINNDEDYEVEASAMTPVLSQEYEPPAVDVMQIQLIPFYENCENDAHTQIDTKKLREGQRLRIGRMVVKEGQPLRPESETEVWFTSKVVSRSHAEMWHKDGQVYIRDVGSSSGTFLNKMRLSPSGKVSRPYPVRDHDVINFGVDFKGKPEAIFKAVSIRVGFCDQNFEKMRRKGSNPAKFQQALEMLLQAANPYGSGQESKDQNEASSSTDCCICIGAIAPFQAIFISPCSHCFHFKCVSRFLLQTIMFQCPICRQVANLTASVSTESLESDFPRGRTVVPRFDAVCEGIDPPRAISEALEPAELATPQEVDLAPSREVPPVLSSADGQARDTQVVHVDNPTDNVLFLTSSQGPSHEPGAVPLAMATVSPVESASSIRASSSRLRWTRNRSVASPESEAGGPSSPASPAVRTMMSFLKKK